MHPCVDRNVRSIVKSPANRDPHNGRHRDPPLAAAPAVGHNLTEACTIGPRNTTTLLFAFAAVALLSGSAQAEGVTGGIGYDTNLFETGDVPGVDRTEAFFAYLQSSRTSYFGSGKHFNVRPGAYLKWVPEASSGNRLGLSAELGYSDRWKGEKREWGRRVLRLSVDAYVDYERALFLRRSIREDIGFGIVNPDLSFSALPRRADFGLRTRLDAQTSKRLTLNLDLFGRVRDYVDSSDPDVASYSKNDDHQIGIALAAELNLPHKWEARLAGMLRHRVNPNRPARYASGSEVTGTERELRYWDLSLSVGLEEGPVSNEVEFGYRRRSDIFDNYYSYDQVELENRLTIETGKESAFDVLLLLGDRNYDLFDPSGEPLENRYLGVGGEVHKDFPDRIRIQIETLFMNNDSNDPVLQYDRWITAAEIRVLL